MNIIESLRKKKAEVTIAVISVSLTSAAALGVNNFILSQSFKATENKEILQSTQRGIGFLKQIEAELDENLSLLVTHDYGASLEVGAPFDTTESMAKLVKLGKEIPDSSDKDLTEEQKKKKAELIDDFLASQSKVMELAVPVKKFNAPIDRLSVEAWDVSGSGLADVNYELLKELSDFYMLARRVNTSIDRFHERAPGGNLTVSGADKLRKLVEIHNENVTKLKSKKIPLLKNQISGEIQRLSIIRDRVIRSI